MWTTRPPGCRSTAWRRERAGGDIADKSVCPDWGTLKLAFEMVEIAYWTEGRAA